MSEPDFTRGTDAFNSGDYFEAHEAWEGLWRRTAESPEKHFLQGMIMIAAALLHYRRGEHAGTSKLLERGMEVLNNSREAKIGIDKEDFLRGVASFRRSFVSHAEVLDDDYPTIRKAANAQSGEGRI